MNDLEAIKLFEDYIRVEKMYSDYTILNYKKDILDFKNFLYRENFGTLLNCRQSVGRYYLSHQP